MDSPRMAIELKELRNSICIRSSIYREWTPEDTNGTHGTVKTRCYTNEGRTCLLGYRGWFY